MKNNGFFFILFWVGILCLIAVIILSLSGCGATLEIQRDEEGQIDKVIVKGQQDTYVKTKDGEEVKSSTKVEPFKDILNINALKD